MFKILLIEENTILRTGIKALFNAHPKFQLFASANSVGEAVRINPLGTVDLIITDVSSNLLQVAQDMEALQSSFPESRILIFTWAGKKESAFAALDANAASYLLKDASGEELLEALAQLVEGKKDSKATVVSTGA